MNYRKTWSQQENVSKQWEKHPAFRFEGDIFPFWEKENPKCSHLQDIMFIVRLALHAPSCTANISGFSAVFLPEGCLQNREFCKNSQFFLVQKQLKTFRWSSRIFLRSDVYYWNISWLLPAGGEWERAAGAVGQPVVSPRIGQQVLPQGPTLCEGFVGFSFWMCFVHFLNFLLGFQSLYKKDSSLKLTEFNICPCS